MGGRSSERREGGGEGPIQGTARKVREWRYEGGDVDRKLLKWYQKENEKKIRVEGSEEGEAVGVIGKKKNNYYRNRT